MTWLWSDQSNNLFDRVQNDSVNIQVSACPGAGKTSNCKEIWSRFSDPSIAYLVFAKANAEEAKQKLQSKGYQSYIGTMHSLGLRAINKANGKDNKAIVDTNGSKIRKFVWTNHTFVGDKHKQIKQGEIIKLVGLLKGVGDASIDTCNALIEMHDLWSFPQLIACAQDTYYASLSNIKVIDFDDMLLFPYVHNKYREALPRYRLVLGDEGQDFNTVQLGLLGSIAERLVVVGDERQAIYGFRGALNDSLEQVRVKYRAERMPLNLTYRCPKNVVAEAQRYYPDDIHAAEDAADGIVRVVESLARLSEDYRTVEDSLLVCRNMAPLVSFAYTLLRNKIAVRLRGRDIGAGLVKFVRHFDCDTIQTLLTALDVWRIEQDTLAREQGNDNKLQTIQDKYETIQVFCDMTGSGKVDEVCNLIESLFASDEGLLMSTIHRAKGLEAERVYWLDPQLVPSSYAKQPWQQTQERNLAYVAITRAKRELVYLPS
jgi:DNA helicase II / ATP-dependent DNA helicase PcrA